jgi:alkylhydroperoxidase family enzyme
MSRIAPLERPFPPAFEAAMAAVMPAGAEPLALFKALATQPRAWGKFAGGSLLDRGPLSLRHREIVIDRTCARCGCEYEWGVHVAGFAAKTKLTPEQIAATVHGDADDHAWADAAERTLVATVDALLDRRRLSDDGWVRLRGDFDEPQALEVIQLVGFYHGVALICGALDLPPEPGAPRFPDG